ncbi:hypothetical protein [Paraburkholderia sp. J67]|uniref:hypothetical protein n=1 Tax=Paraburkholderia sp. J67 TaxID=2805435 RepID=UPI002ABD5270|nr:hypothetical protein [Paraburkholderia sp. J67]
MFNNRCAPRGACPDHMASFLPNRFTASHTVTPRAPRPKTPAKRRAPSALATVQMTVRVATRDAQLARCLLHGLLGHTLGVHTIDIDRRRDLACLHVELEHARVPDVMALLIRSLPGAEFGAIRRLDRNH